MAYFLSTIQPTAYYSTGNFKKIPYKLDMIKDNLFDHLQNNINTIFYNKNLKKAFVGSVFNIKKNINGVEFDISITSEIRVDSLPNHLIDDHKWAGWYKLSDDEYNSIVIKNTNIMVKEEKKNFTPENNNILHPPFFNKLLNTNNKDEFEDLTYKLIRLIGIHESIQIDRREAAGRGDGFFKLSSLSVIYDCTLRTSFVDFKREQINNYCSRLNSGHFEYSSRIFSTVDTEKQVWIITRGKGRNIEIQNNVIVKEVSIQDLIKLYTIRLNNSFNEIDLRNKLSKL